MTTAQPSPSPRRRWLSFSLRGMFLVITVACVALAIYGVLAAKARKQEQVVAKVQKLGGNLHFDYQRDGQGGELPNAKPAAPQWLRKAVGEEYFRRVVSAGLNVNGGLVHGGLKVRDDDLAVFRDLPGLEVLELSNTPITDEGIAHLSGLSDLRTLYLYRTQVRGPGLAHLPRGLVHLELRFTPLEDQGLAHLKGMSELNWLRLDNTEVTDKGLAHLRELSALEELTLGRTDVSDVGLKHLERLTSLKQVWLGKTKVTGNGIRELRQALPNCQVFPEPEWVDAMPQDVELWHDDYKPSHEEVLAKIQELGDADVKLGQDAAGAPTIISFRLFNSTISDESLIRLLAEMPDLEILNLRHVLVGDRLAQELPHLKKLWMLALGDSRLSDEGLRSVAQIQRLRDLDVAETEISDAGLVHLASAKTLEFIHTNNTCVTDDGLVSLKQALPKLNIAK